MQLRRADICLLCKFQPQVDLQESECSQMQILLELTQQDKQVAPFDLGFQFEGLRLRFHHIE